jgi:CRP-like cAMP-binding protein
MEQSKAKLTDYIKSVYPVSDFALKLIVERFEFVTFPKNTIVLSEGKINSDYIFLESGFMRSFVFDINGVDVTTNIFKPNEIVLEVESYFQRKPSIETIQTVTDCTAWVGKYEIGQQLFHSLPEFREFGRAALINAYSSYKTRTIGMIIQKAEKRYEQILKESPEILQNVPLKYIASYLGITDTSLSRIRKELAQK